MGIPSSTNWDLMGQQWHNNGICNQPKLDLGVSEKGL
jgi:hypothetical protein